MPPYSVSKNHLARERPSLLLEEKVSPVRKLVTDVVLECYEFAESIR